MPYLLPWLSFVGLATAASFLNARALCGEGIMKICYGLSGGETQHLDVDDIQYVANYFRTLSDNDNPFLNMPQANDCAEWSLSVPGAGTVLALAKHINPRVNSSILYEDIAATIDGGPNAPDDARQNSLIGCGAHGGQLGVKANLDNPLYNALKFKESGAQANGVIIKLVRAPGSS